MFKIIVLAGDGIGPEVTKSAMCVLDEISTLYQHEFIFDHKLIGGAAVDESNDPLPSDTLKSCLESDAVFLGAIGGPKWDSVAVQKRPEQGILRLRKELNVFANIRPLQIYKSLFDSSPLKATYLTNVDFVIVRELTGGIYFGEKKRTKNVATDLCSYSTDEVERICKVACELAMQRDRYIVSVDKANVLETSRLWRETVSNFVRENYPQITLEHALVDSTAMKLIQNPTDFDVILTENMFGDILSDEASVLAGSLGLLPSASLSETNLAVYEPVHGSAPDIAGKNIANPYGAILSLAMMCRHSFKLESEAQLIELAVEQTIDNGYLPLDLSKTKEASYSTDEITRAVIEQINSIVFFKQGKVQV